MEDRSNLPDESNQIINRQIEHNEKAKVSNSKENVNNDEVKLQEYIKKYDNVDLKIVKPNLDICNEIIELINRESLGDGFFSKKVQKTTGCKCCIIF